MQPATLGRRLFTAALARATEELGVVSIFFSVKILKIRKRSLQCDAAKLAPPCARARGRVGGADEAF